MRDRHGYADRRQPSWSKPLAPLPEWLDSVDALLSERTVAPIRLPTTGNPYRRRRPIRAIAYHRHLCPTWLRRWRRRLHLTPGQAAELLGYCSALEIRTIERGSPVSRSPRRQMELVSARAPEAAQDRGQWLLDWRLRMGITTRQATEILGYSNRFNHYRAEGAHGRPSWEKILIAVAEERMAAEARERSPTAVNLLSK